MRFNFFVSLIFTVTVVALGSDNLFTLQESSEDLLPSFETSNALEDLYPDHHNVAAAAGDLFTDSTDSTDFSAGVDGALNNFESLEASCPSKNDQPSRRARTRRDEVCAPKDQPSINGLTNTLGIFGVPSQREEALQRAAASSVKADTASICIPPFLNHLCCQLQGNLIIMPSMPISPKFSGEMYDTMQNCHPGTWNCSRWHDRYSGMKCTADRN